MRPYEKHDLLGGGVSISQADLDNGSPKVGDMIARNPQNHEDEWLVAEDYYKENFELDIRVPITPEQKIAEGLEGINKECKQADMIGFIVAKTDVKPDVARNVLDALLEVCNRGDNK